MKAAFQALLKGDLAERDRQVDLAMKALKSERLQHLLEIDFFVTPEGVVIPTTAMMAKA